MFIAPKKHSFKISSNSKAFALELLENLEGMFHRYSSRYINMFSTFIYLINTCGFPPSEKFNSFASLEYIYFHTAYIQSCLYNACICLYVYMFICIMYCMLILKVIFIYNINKQDTSRISSSYTVT